MASEDFSFESSYFMSTTDSRHVSFCIAPPSPNAKQSLLQDSDDKDFQFNIGSAAMVNDSSFESLKKKHGIHRSTESMAPSVAFADELFCDGKVKASGCRIPAAVASSQRSPLTPFVTALERVKDNHRVNTLNHRLAQSSSPFYHHQLLRETKGVDLSRRLREVRTLGNYGDSGRETKKQKLMRFLTIRSKSVEKEEDGDHHESKRSETEKKSVAMAMAFTASATRNGSRAVTKVPAMQHRSRLFLCLGYGF